MRRKLKLGNSGTLALVMGGIESVESGDQSSAVGAHQRIPSSVSCPSLHLRG